MNNVLITGGTGFVGHHMRLTQPKNLNCRYIGRKDYGDYWGPVNYIVHLAPISPVGALAHAGFYKARVLYASSGIVYHQENNTEYRQNKIRWEKECLDEGIDVVIARLFTFYGEKLSPDHAIVAFENAAREGRQLNIWGDGSCVRSYMHGREMARWIWAILLRGRSGEAYDVGSDEPITMLELAKRYSDNIFVAGGVDPMPVYLPVDTAKTKRLLE